MQAISRLLGLRGGREASEKIDRLSAGTFDREGIVRAVAALAGSRSIPARRF
jgi:hypothetical protein